MKPALHFIWSPLLFSITGFMVAREIALISPSDPEFQRFVLLMMPASGLFIGWFIVYLATPVKMRPDTTFISGSFAKGETGVNAAVSPSE
ncbi:hypothetical protein [Schlesneria paludicola]|uniref:hypothetical protein n=1 Tax=Schlesneria paludicola TaxID=360056 RepID=UPI00029B30B6|nr:hypothetical protein [Schlesneria paludicola]